MTVILRLFLILLPGIFTGFALWKISGALISILAALGVETLALMALGFGMIVAEAWRQEKERTRGDLPDSPKA